MQRSNDTSGVKRDEGVSRRDFLRAGSLGAGAAGLSLAERPLHAARSAGDRSCIFLLLVGGPSHLDTWDPKPAAPSDVRGPFRAIPTSVPGIALSEIFPRMAQRADRFAIVRSMHHAAAPIHETGHQLLQTGRLARGGVEHPHIGSVLAQRFAERRSGIPPFVVLGGPIGNTGVSVGHGQTAGFLGRQHDPLIVARDAAVGAAFDLAAERAATRERYGPSAFGRACLLARRLVEGGVRLVTVNMFNTVFDRISWDCHADGGSLPTTLDDYRNVLGPLFDQAYVALLDDLHERGLLADTLVVATGEFGRTPRLNARGGRDHWPGVWSALVAGGGVRGGQVVGASDRLGGEPRDRPVEPAALAATIYQALGIHPSSRLAAPGGQAWPLTDAAPVTELFG